MHQEAAGVIEGIRSRLRRDVIAVKDLRHHRSITRLTRQARRACLNVSIEVRPFMGIRPRRRAGHGFGTWPVRRRTVLNRSHLEGRGSLWRGPAAFPLKFLF